MIFKFHVYLSHVTQYISNQIQQRKIKKEEEKRIQCAKISCWLLCFVSWVTVLMWTMDQKLLNISRFAAYSILSPLFLNLGHWCLQRWLDTHPRPCGPQWKNDWLCFMSELSYSLDDAWGFSVWSFCQLCRPFFVQCCVWHVAFCTAKLSYWIKSFAKYHHCLSRIIIIII